MKINKDAKTITESLGITDERMEEMHRAGEAVIMNLVTKKEYENKADLVEDLQKQIKPQGEAEFFTLGLVSASIFRTIDRLGEL